MQPESLSTSDGPVRVLVVTPAPTTVADRLRALGGEVAVFASGLAALAHWDSAAGPAPNRFDAAVIDEAADELSGPALTVVLRSGGFAGPLIGLSDAPASPAADRWRKRGCDLVLRRGGDHAAALALVAATLERLAGTGAGVRLLGGHTGGAT